MVERNGHAQTSAPDNKPQTEQPAWRQAFPIDVGQDRYVARRDFTKFMVLTSLAFVVGQLWVLVQSWFRKSHRPPRREIATLAPGHPQLPHLPVGGVLRFGYPEADDHCLLFRTAENDLLAYDQKCTHLSCEVVPDLANGRLDCPCHKGLFDLKTGRPLAGPPRRPLPRVVLEVQDGVILATGLELRAP